MKLLIVDDLPTNLKLLRLQLEAEGHAVVEAGDGVEALQVLEREPVDGVVSDILMPRMDGYRLCMEVRQSKRFGGVPFVLYTSTYNDPADRELAHSAGADGYVSKPAPIATILALLRAGASQGRSPPRGDLRDIERPVLRQYSESLVRKLEEKRLELEHAYEGLAQMQARLSDMVESAMDAIVAVDEQQHVVLFNAAAEQMFGCPRAKALGKPLDAFIPQRFGVAHARHIEHFGQADAAHRRMGERMVWALRADGTEFPVEASLSTSGPAQGRIYTAFIRDIAQRHQAEQALVRSEAGLRHAQQLAKLAYVITGPAGEFESWNDSLQELTGVDADRAPKTTQDWLELVHPDDAELFRSRAIHAAGQNVRTEVAYRLRRNGSWTHVRQIIDPLPGPAGDAARPTRWFHTLQDISEQKKSDLKIRSQNRVLAVLSGIYTLIVRTTDRDELFREACRIAVDVGQFPNAWIGLVDEETNLIRIVASYGAPTLHFTRLQAFLVEDTLDGKGLVACAVREARPAVVNDLETDLRVIVGRADALDVGARSIAVLPFVVEGRVAGVIALQAEIAEFFDSAEMNLLGELAADLSFALGNLRKEQQLLHLAHYDVLTGLPNRRLFSERLSQALQAHSGDTVLAVVMVDLERFRRVNETLGRAAGDELLNLTAARLLHANGSAARIGVDMFALMIPDKHSAIEVARELEQIWAHCFAEPFKVAGEELRIGCRAGVGLFPGDGIDAESVLRNAEAALRRAKLRLEQCVFYAPELNARAAEALKLESKLRRAIERHEFVLHYQPKVNFGNRHICGVEALIRWQDPERGLVAPGQFIPVLEESGLIGVVGEWALQQALSDQLRWREAGVVPPRVAVNVSPLQLRKHDFADIVTSVVTSSQGGELELEITESVIMENVDRTIAALKQIRALGVTVAIDDFGTGYCSLSYIARLPVTSLKIDRSFVLGMTESPEGLAIVSAIISLAHSLKLKVVAEGVETQEQANLLHLLACDEAQGYLYCKPIPYDGILNLRRSGEALPVPVSA